MPTSVLATYGMLLAACVEIHERDHCNVFGFDSVLKIVVRRTRRSA